MAKFKVKVKAIAECEYEVEIDHDTEKKAEQEAAGMWRKKMPSDFQVAEGYVTDWQIESEQLMAICPACGTEHAIPTADSKGDSWYEDYEYCKPCGAKIELEEKKNG